MNLGGVETEGDGYIRARLLSFNVGCQRSDEREVGRSFAGAWDDEGIGEVEGVGSRDTSIEGGRIRDELEGFLAEECVVAGFDS